MTELEQTVDIDRQTLAAWKRGSVRAFETIVKATMQRAFAVALGIVGNVEDAWDLSQECYMAAHKARRSFDIDRPFFPWFYRILRNRCLNFIERRKRRREVSLDVLVERADRTVSPEIALIRREQKETLWKVLFTLSPEHREIIVLREFQELSYQEISSMLDIAEGTVMSRLYYARKALHDALKKAGVEPFGEGG
ncbi:MAG: RNA polymerase sigma factor [bacterium]|nr:MAG: RNA polymerase sigma factor [bacterium]